MQDDEGVLQGREGGQYRTRQIKAVEQSRAGQGRGRIDRIGLTDGAAVLGPLKSSCLRNSTSS